MESSRGIVEVIWEGKYSSEGELQRPNAETLLTGLVPAAFNIVGRIGAGENRLMVGDNLEGLRWLCENKPQEPPIKLIYIDPPFDIGREMIGKFSVNGQDLSIPCYDDRWGKSRESFAYFMWERLIALHEVLAEDGSIFVHTNDHSAPLLRALMDDVFGKERFLNQIIWHYTGGGRAKNRFSNKHDVILWYSKGEKYTFNADAIRVPYKESSGYAKGGITAASGKHYKPNPKGTVPSDVWEIPMVNPMAGERTGYPTQKPLALLERLILAASNEGDCVADVFCGSGSTLIAAEKLGRRFLGIDASGLAFSTALRRLLESESSCEIGIQSRSNFERTPFYIKGTFGAEDYLVESYDNSAYFDEDLNDDPNKYAPTLMLLFSPSQGELLWHAQDLQPRMQIPMRRGDVDFHGANFFVCDARGCIFWAPWSNIISNQALLPLA